MPEDQQQEWDEHGRPETPTTAGEITTLTAFLDFLRSTLEWKCRGLSDEQLSATHPPTAMTLGGLLKHLGRVEDYWFGEVVGEGGKLEPWASMEWAAEWQDAKDSTGEELRRLWADRCQAARDVVSAQLSGPDPLDRTYAAWDGQGRVTLRWVLTHMIEEYARHVGHADLLREAVDGETGE